MPLKYENVAKVGDRIRSYDFAGNTDCYVEGRVMLIDRKGWDKGYSAFVIAVDKDGWPAEGDDTSRESRVGLTIWVPMESLWDWEGRVVNLGVTKNHTPVADRTS